MVVHILKHTYTWTWGDSKRVIWTAIGAFGPAFSALKAGVLAVPKLSTAAALVPAFLITGGAAAFSAVKNLLLSDDSPLK